MKIFHMKICELLVSNPKSNHFYWALFWVGVIYLILRFETHLVSLRMLKVHHLFVVLGRGHSPEGLNVFYRQRCFRGGFSRKGPPHPGRNHDSQSHCKEPLKPGRFQTFQKRDFCWLRVVPRSWRNQGICKNVKFLACQGMRLYIYSTSFGPWISGFLPEIAAFHGQDLCFFFMFASKIIQFDAPSG